MTLPIPRRNPTATTKVFRKKGVSGDDLVHHPGAIDFIVGFAGFATSRRVAFHAMGCGSVKPGPALPF